MLPETKSAILHDIDVAIERALIGRSCRSLILMSENSTELSVLIDCVQALINEKRQITRQVFVQNGLSLQSLIQDSLPKLASDFNIIFDLDGTPSELVSDIFTEIGTTLVKKNLSWILLIDRLDAAEAADLEMLISAIHASNQKSLPILCIGVGSPQLTKMIGDAKPYAERLFQFKTI